LLDSLLQEMEDHKNHPGKDNISKNKII